MNLYDRFVVALGEFLGGPDDECDETAFHRRVLVAIAVILFMCLLGVLFYEK